MNFESDWAKIVVPIVPKVSYTSSTLIFDPATENQQGSKTCMWSLKEAWLERQPVLCLQCFIHRLPELTLTSDPITKINMVPPFIVYKLNVKYESDLETLKSLSRPQCQAWLQSISCTQGSIHGVLKLAFNFDSVTPTRFSFSSHHPQLACEIWKRLGT